jgi:predicted ArsR family transcriptional regulator
VNTLQQQARALGDPTRHQIYTYVADAERPVGVAELTDHIGFNHNAIRQHLAKLVDAGLLAETTQAQGGRGRPRLVYVVDPGAEARWGAVTPYERLSVLLADVVRSGDTPVDVGVRAGREYDRRGPGGETGGAEIDQVVELMARLGFEPEARRRGRGTDVVLHACPFASAALTDPDTVCSLHLGLAQGFTEGSGLEVTELVVKDPRRAGCRLRLQPTTGADALG